MSIWRWADRFCETPAAHHTTLGEGNTPLVRSCRIGPRVGLEHLYFKLETTNPTGSYKDRFGTAAISDMLAHGKTKCVATSSGNTGSALAAYCAASGISCQIAIVDNAPPDKLKQMMAYGADIFTVKGYGSDAKVSDQVIAYLQNEASQPDAQLQISAFAYSPAGMAGVQTISYELHEQAKAEARASRGAGRIDHVFVPAGGGGLTLAVARGFAGLVERDELESSPAVHCVQPEGCDTMAGLLRQGADRGQSCQCTSKISGLQVAKIIDGDEVIPACRMTGGNGHLIADETAWQVQKRLAREEGLFCEPAGAVALGGALSAFEAGEISGDDCVVCLVTGIGFKDTPSVDRMLADTRCPTLDVSQLNDRR